MTIKFQGYFFKKKNYNTEDNMKKENGITLIALIITIIIMLILVIVTVSFAINGGLFNNAKKASDEYSQAIENEKKIVDDVDNYLNDSNDIINKDNAIKSCNIEIINQNGPIVTVSAANVDSKNEITGYVYLLDGTVINISTEETFDYVLESDNNDHIINVIVVDKYGNCKKSDSIKYNTNKYQMLYYYGKEYEDVTGGWIAEATQSNGIAQKNSNNMYLSYKRTGGSGSRVKTANTFNVSDYEIAGTVIMMEKSAGGSYTSMNAMGRSIPYGYQMEKHIYELDISSKTSLQPMFENWDTSVYIYAAWFEDSEGTVEYDTEECKEKVTCSDLINSFDLSVVWAQRGEVISEISENIDISNVSGYAVLADGELISIGQDSRRMFEYSDDLTSKKVEVIVFDKSGNIYKYEQNNIEKFDRVYLYKYGDECVDITGGWTGGNEQSRGRFRKEADYLFMGYTSSGGSEAHMSTNNIIDFSNYKKLYVHYKIDRNAYSYSTFFGKLHFYNGSIEKEFPSYANGDVTDSIDISNCTQDKILFRNWDVDNYIYEIWFE